MTRLVPGARGGYGPVMRRWMTLLLLGGCTTTTDQAIDTGPTGPPSITLIDPKPSATPACRAIGSDVQAHVPLVLDVVNIVLRPPGGCSGITQCGHLRLSVGGIFNDESAAKSIDLLVGKLANPYHDGSTNAGTGKADVLDLAIDAVDDNGVAMLGADGKPLHVATTLIVAASCK